ncbi:putative F-box protein At5g55150 [Eucalyptus grandis]|uniref:putative F-box protein At5g55150 n=1 Tax=Eucalyptus grandis TaxID=71139 RepID=UPI00192F09F4|nr:putative F-box protein At5g55150 [Eucalyptus grandis]
MERTDRKKPCFHGTAGDWSDLPSPLIELIAYRLPLDDLIDFSETCSHWRNVVVRLQGGFQRRISLPWLMIANPTRPNSPGFFSLRRQSFYEFPLREVRRKRCLSSRGWIMTIGGNGNVRLFNPLSRGRARVKLSALKPDGYINVDIGKFALSACPLSSAESDIMVLGDIDRRLALWNYQDRAWTMVSPHRIYMDLIYHKGRFLAVDATGTIRAFPVKLDGPNPATDGRVVAWRPPGLVKLEHLKKHYLVECWGSLLVLSQEWRQGFVTSGFQAFLLDLEASTWTKINSLGDRSLFLGLNSSFSMEVIDRHGGIEPNCIYFTDDCTYNGTGGKDMGIYHMADGRIDPLLFDAMPHRPDSTPLWIEPNAG